MLKAGMFDDFKGATTLLLWGDRDGMARLHDGLSALRRGDCDKLEIGGPHGSLTIQARGGFEGSSLQMEETGFLWDCSLATADFAAGLVAPLLRAAGHQFLAVDGLVEQVIIARDEYPDDFG
jgi:hypothetical protein